MADAYEKAVLRQDTDEMADALIDDIHIRLAIPGTSSGVVIAALALAARRMAEMYTEKGHMTELQIKIKACEIILDRKIILLEQD